MKRKWMRRTALCCMAGVSGVVGQWVAPNAAHADEVTTTTTLSQVNRLSLFHDYSIDALGLTTGSVPGSAGSGVLNPLLPNYTTTEPVGPGRSYEIFATPVVGYDSNPEARRFAQGSIFGGADLGAVYRVNLGAGDPTVGSPTQFQFSYDLTGAVYDGTVLNADVLQQTIAGSYRRSMFHDSLWVGFGLNDQFTMEHGEAFLNTFDASPSVEWFATPQISLEANYDYTRMGYFIRVLPRLNPDANRHTANLKVHFYSFPQQRGDIPESPDVLGDILRATLHRATIGYAYVDNEGTGLDYVYDANRLTIGVEGIQIPRFRYVTLDMNYAHEWQNFESPSIEGPLVLAGSPKQRRRKDHIDVFTVRANSRLMDFSKDRGSLSSFLQWDLIADRSSIPARHFNEFVISAGLNYQW